MVTTDEHVFELSIRYMRADGSFAWWSFFPGYTAHTPSPVPQGPYAVQPPMPTSEPEAEEEEVVDENIWERAYSDIPRPPSASPTCSAYASSVSSSSADELEHEHEHEHVDNADEEASNDDDDDEEDVAATEEGNAVKENQRP